MFGGLLMGCINGKQLLNEEDLNYIARNTAMDKAAVEVRTNQTFLFDDVCFEIFGEGK